MSAVAAGAGYFVLQSSLRVNAEARPLPDLPAKVPVTSPDSLIRQRPDVVSAERRLAAQTAFVGAAKADYLPRLSLQGGAGITGCSDEKSAAQSALAAVGTSASAPGNQSSSTCKGRSGSLRPT